MSNSYTRLLASRAKANFREGLEEKHVTTAGTVSSVQRNEAGQIHKATVTLPGGARVVGLDAGGLYGMGEGAKVLLDAVGSKAAPVYTILKVIEQAVGTPGSGTGEIVSTPVHAFIETAAALALAGSVLINAEFGFYLIAEQWQYDQAVAYEVEVRNATTLQQKYRSTTNYFRRVGGSLKTGIDADDTTIQVEANGQSNPYSEFDETNGIALIGSELVRYESVNRFALYIELVGVTRGAFSTTAAAHSAGAEVTWRGMSLPVLGLDQDTAYEAHIRAINATGNYSNWSTWESFTSDVDTVTVERPAANLLTNGEFDSNITGWTVNAGSMDATTHNAGVGYRAAGSLQVEIGRTGGGDDNMFFSQTVSGLTAGDRVRARIFVSRSGGDFDETGDIAQLILQAGVASTGSGEVDGTEIVEVGGQRWTLLEAETTVPPGLTSVVFLFSIEYAGGPVLDVVNLYFDDAQLFVVSHESTRVSTTGLTVGEGDEVTKILSEVASLNFGSISTGQYQDLTITVTGAASGDMCNATPASGIEAGLTWNGWVSAADTVTVRLWYHQGALGSGSVDPAARNWRATVFKF
jgi:hypothetical protein